jgi:hypothetical protein
LSVAFHPSGEAPAAAVSSAAAPIGGFLASGRRPRHRRASTGPSTLASADRHPRPDQPRIQHDTCDPRIPIAPSRPAGPETGRIPPEPAPGRGLSPRP